MSVPLLLVALLWQSVATMRPGGQLDLVVQEGRLPPLHYELSGPFLARMQPRDGKASLAGLPPGDYRLTPVYEGLIKGEPRRLTIVIGRTTSVTLEPEEVGAAAITAGDETCARADNFVLSARLVSTADARLARGDIVETTEIAACRWRFGGLRPGLYEATLRVGRRIVGRVQFKAMVDRIADVVIVPPAVTVSGMVTVDDQPAADAIVGFQNATRVLTMPVQPDGSYDVALEEEGVYDVTLRTADRRMLVRRETLRPGHNTVDIAIGPPAATELTIRVSGADPAMKIDVDIRDADSASVTSTPMAPGATATTRRGLPLGTYRVVAHQPGATSERQVFELSRDRMTVEVALTLTRVNRTITMRYGDGEPVVHPAFSDVPVAPPEVSPGSYSLAAVEAGIDLIVKPPSGTPFCRVVHAQGDVDVVVDAGRPLILQFEDPRVAAADVRIAAANATCAVPLDRFLKTGFVPGPGGSRRVEILNAPSDSVLIVHTPRGAHEVMVPPEGIAIVPASR